MFRCSAHLGVQLLLHVRAAGRRQNVVQHYEGVTLQVKGQVIAATRETSYTNTPLLTPQHCCPSQPHLAAIKAPKIMVNTVSLIDVEKLFLRKRNQLKLSESLVGKCTLIPTPILLQQESFKHHGEKNTEPSQNCEHGQTRTQERTRYSPVSHYGSMF